ncbi:hypothetical protein [Halorussus caseinilyticus]|uniref:Uncharacterized protein n=1 Tax=Halorussus caseinilyticus TaxID=3034025 RepID=A0ABD5WR08_9EURY
MSASGLFESIDLREVKVGDDTLFPEEGDETTLTVEIRSTYDETKWGHVVPHLYHQNYIDDQRVYLNPDTYGGNAIEIPPNQTTEYTFEWAPGVFLEPGIYHLEVNVNDENDEGGWNDPLWASWYIENAVAVGFDIDLGCYQSIRNYQKEVRSKGGPSVSSAGNGIGAAMSLISIIYSQNQVASNCGD